MMCYFNGALTTNRNQVRKEGDRSHATKADLDPLRGGAGVMGVPADRSQVLVVSQGETDPGLRPVGLLTGPLPGSPHLALWLRPLVLATTTSPWLLLRHKESV